MIPSTSQARPLTRRTLTRRPSALPGVVIAALLLCLASPACAPAAQLELERTVDGLERPVDLVTAPGDARLYIVEQPGRIRVVENGKLREEPFLDISALTSRGNEQGLLGMAFHPRYRSNGYVFVNYTGVDGNTNVVRYRALPGGRRLDPATATLILSVDQPYANHNGGHLLFGPDSMLYIPLGDGGSGGDPKGNGQNTHAWLGKLLRIDIDHGTPYAIPRDNPFADGKRGRPEVWAYGLRNPWRIAFDAGQLYIADVGQNRWEEVDVAPANKPGINYGWNLLEGTHTYDKGGSGKDRGAPAGLGTWPPAVEYPHSEGCCVIGGGVYHGSIAALRGHYIYSDACSGWIASFVWKHGQAEQRARWRTSRHITPNAFGVDARGEMYVLDMGGKVYRLAALK